MGRWVLTKTAVYLGGEINAPASARKLAAVNSEICDLDDLGHARTCALPNRANLAPPPRQRLLDRMPRKRHHRERLRPDLC